MGRNSRTRARAERRREQTSRATAPPDHDRPGPSSDRALPLSTDELVIATATARRASDPRYERLLSRLIDRPDAWAAIARYQALAVSRLLDGGGWLPDEVPRFVGRELPRAHAALAAATVLTVAERLTAEAPAGAGWQASLDRVAEGAGPAAPPDVRVGLELFALVWGMPVILEIEPPPGRAATGRPARPADPVTARHLERVRALLAKAESTTFPEEADAFTAKAQELIARHSIAAAMLHDGAAPGGRSAPVTVRLWLDDPYADAKSWLLSEVAGANGGRCVMSPSLGFCTVFAFPDDVAAIELLYTSLRVQAVAAMTRHGAVRDADGRVRTRAFRRSFLQAFAMRIGDRLHEATRATVAAAEGRAGGDALLPALHRRDEEVEAAERAAFPNLRTKTPRGGLDPAGWAAGTTAANLARIGIDAPRLRPSG